MSKFKRNLIKAIFILLVFLAFLGLFVKRFEQPRGKIASSLGPTREEGIVIIVYDGDTIKVRFKDGLLKKVRLIGIDAPEIGDQRENVKFWAQMARRFAFFYLFRKQVRLSYDWQLEDKYERLLAYVWTEEGLFNDFIIREGYAFVFLKFPYRKDYQEKFKRSEEYARKNKRGLWKEEDFPQIQVHETKYHLGRILKVGYKCSTLETKRQFLFLHSPDKEFSALIPKENLSQFPDSKDYLNKNLLITGFLEEYRGQPQIIVYFPHQVKIID